MLDRLMELLNGNRLVGGSLLGNGSILRRRHYKLIAGKKEFFGLLNLIVIFSKQGILNYNVISHFSI